MLKKTTIWC